MWTLEFALANAVLVLFVVPNDILTLPAVRAERVLRLALQRHTALRRPVLARQASEGIPVNYRLAASAPLPLATFLLGGQALSPVSTFQGAQNLAVLPDEGGALAIAARSTSQGRGGIDVVGGEIADGRFNALAGVAAAAVGVIDEGARSGNGGNH
eukprot:CAMPEP_0172537682 /NCGR_PEP_ID=MMETSP1067-20121228/9247_1 /TAXON_ID=265564 ORGANISM="Thalassiosira punctigera, Strain Tpunct2005C2" /NCGR_SAMPLE_ID=MMETSP1067 /ASSEMBLY_ACC=CAM_ASM_000444 /LENGTH=155 /DNA_ID=CAMNT_0013323037 /DNA_START=415 /DNA_END=882 /DNA_ORIENTATION=+